MNLPRAPFRRLSPKPAALLALTALLCFRPISAPANPPAPYHIVYGAVRDEYGTPFTSSATKVILQTPGGVRVSGTVIPGLAPGVNYQVEVPMDSGLTPANYTSSALRSTASYKLYVVLGGVTNLPIQMTGDFSRLGTPGQRTRIDLTVGDDANANGLPDAWELAFLAVLGSPLNLADLKANGIYTTDGRTLHQQFLLGNYPFDPSDSFALKLVEIQNGSALLEFTTMTGRSYSVQGSPDLQQWTSLSFKLPASGTARAAQSYLYAPDIRAVQIQALQPPAVPPMRFFRLVLQ
jgi:hypothetical protein